MTDLDHHLRTTAHRWFDAATEPTRSDHRSEADVALAEVLARVSAGRPAATGRVRHAGRRWAVAASILALLAGGAVLVATLDGDDQLRSGVDTVPTTIDIAASSAPAPATTGTATTLPAPADDTLAVAVPDVVTAGDTVTITVTPAGVVPRRCVDAVVVSVYDAGSDGAFTTLGEVGASGALVPFDPATDRACDRAPSAEPVTVSVPTTLAAGEYRWCVSPNDAPRACASVTVVATTSEPVAGPGRSPVPYVVMRSLPEADPATRLMFELRDVAPDGTDLGRSTADAAYLAGFPVDLGGGVAMGLSPTEWSGPSDGRCRTLAVARRGTPESDLAPGDEGVRDLPEIPGGSSMVGNASRVVVGRDVCPAGTRWGDPGTYFELVAYDPAVAAPEPMQLVRIDPDPDAVLFDDGTVVYATDALGAVSVSPSGDHVGVIQFLNTEQARWHVYGTLAPGAPLVLGSACASPGDIVGRPSFPSSDVVVVARRCEPASTGPTGLVVEAVSLTDLSPLWSHQVDGVAISGYTAGVSDVSSTFVDGGLWVIVASSAGVEQPVRAALLHGDDEIDITRLDDPDVYRYAFTAAELVDLSNFMS
jgi:hypothetical protein